MNERKELLNEESYLKSKNKLLKIAKIILIAGLVIGVGFIIGGIAVIINTNKNNQNIDTATKTETKEEIQNQINDLENELASLKAKKNNEFHANGFSEEYYKLENQIEAKQDKIWELEDKIDEGTIKQDAVEKLFSKIFKSTPGVMMIIIGISVISGALFISMPIFFIAKKREITAFTMQQTMPLAQEGMEKVAPSLGKVAKEIKKGLKDE